MCSSMENWIVCNCQLFESGGFFLVWFDVFSHAYHTHARARDEKNIYQWVDSLSYVISSDFLSANSILIELIHFIEHSLNEHW